jgi:hypothetical protein
MLENTEEESKMDNPEKLATIGYIKRKQTKQNTICVGHHYA